MALFISRWFVQFDSASASLVLLEEPAAYKLFSCRLFGLTGRVLFSAIEGSLCAALALQNACCWRQPQVWR